MSEERLEDRFQLLELAFEGGMGVIHRARDRRSGQAVAVKLLRSPTLSVSRFRQEAELLRELHHDHVVRYIAHGQDASGRAYLAMEWLSGVSLAARLSRGALGVDEAVRIVVDTAAGLAAAHARGVVHRDLKPENLLLVDGQASRVKILDFGVALDPRAERLTRAGAKVGTLGYMAPEQARGQGDVDARADVFALGCVLYECLTGRPAFWAEHPLAVLTRILVDTPAPPSSLRPEVPPALDEVVALLLAKQREDRPADGARVVRLLEGMESPSNATTSPPPSLSTDEQSLLSVVLVTPASANAEAQTWEGSQQDAFSSRAAAIAARAGGRVETLATGALIALFHASGAPREVALSALSAARELIRALPNARVSVATGFGRVEGSWPVGEAVDRAVALATPGPGLAVDDATLGLLPASIAPIGAQPEHSVASTMVGRARELATLSALVQEAFDEPVARIALVSGPAGIGKTTLLERLLAELELPPRTTLWLGRPQGVGSPSPFSLLRSALAHATQDPSEFLSPELSPKGSQHRDPQWTTDRIQQGFVDLVGRVTERGPLLLVLEDIHRADTSSLELLGRTLRAWPDLPVAVVATVRSGGSDGRQRDPSELLLPDAHRVLLRPLAARDASRLCSRILGPKLGSEASRIVQDAGGNPFLIAELSRARVAGQDVPTTALALASARLDGLDDTLRRVLRAASVFGERFIPAGLSAVLGAPDGLQLGAQLSELERLGFLAADGEQFAFSHALMRDAAYASLLTRDLQLAHALAGAFLEGNAESDPAVLAEHFARAEDGERAASHLARAAEVALGASEFERALALTDQVQAPLLARSVRLRLDVTRAEAMRWLGKLEDAAVLLLNALDQLTPQDESYFRLHAEAALVLQRLGRTSDLSQLADAFAQTVASQPASDASCHAGARIALLLRLAGDSGRSTNLLAQLRTTIATAPWLSDATRGHAHLAHAFEALHQGDLGDYLEQELAALRCFELASDRRRALNERVSVGYALAELGQLARAEAELALAVAEAQKMGLSHVQAAAEHNLGLVLAERGRLDEAREMELSALKVFREQKDARLEGATRIYLARVELLAENFEQAERHAADALEQVTLAAPPIRPLALAVLSLAKLGGGAHDAALTTARQAWSESTREGGTESGETLVVIALVSALRAKGDFDMARNTARSGLQQLRARAARIANPEHRDAFVRAPDARRLAALAELAAESPPFAAGHDH